MIAIILAGGYGTRLYPLTICVAKPLLPVGERTILDIICEKLVNLKEISGIILTTNRRFEHRFREWLSKRPYKNIRIRSEESRSEADKLGAIRALSEVVEEEHAEDYMVLAGDNLFTSELDAFIRHYREKGGSTIALYDVKDHAIAKEFSVVSIDAEGKITGFEEKPDKPKSTLIGTCVYLLPARTSMKVHEYLGSGGNPDSPGHFIEWLFRREPIYGYMIPGKWWDIGTPKPYEEARNFYVSWQPLQPVL